MNDEANISTFAELMDEIAYDWGFNKQGLVKEKDHFWVNKTTITPTEVTYKTSRYKITNPMVYKKLEKFYELLQETEQEKILYK